MNIKFPPPLVTISLSSLLIGIGLLIDSCFSLLSGGHQPLLPLSMGFTFIGVLGSTIYQALKIQDTKIGAMEKRLAELERDGSESETPK